MSIHWNKKSGGSVWERADHPDDNPPANVILANEAYLAFMEDLCRLGIRFRVDDKIMPDCRVAFEIKGRDKKNKTTKS